MALDIGNLLQQYMGGQVQPQKAEEDFDRVKDVAAPGELADGVAEAFRSDQTPPFPQMVSQLFGNSDPNQRAGVLNQLLATLGPTVLSSLRGGGLGRLIQDRTDGQHVPQLTAEEAAQVSPEEVQQVAERAQQQDPGIIDQMGKFYAQNPTLIKALGGAALAIALGRMAQGMRKQ